jgi:aminopeptidase N
LGAVSSGQEDTQIEQVLARLDALSAESFFLTQMAAIQALGGMKTAKAMEILQNIAASTPDGRVQRRAEETVQKVQKAIGSDSAVETLRQEIEQLKKSNQTLKSRVEALEAKGS